MEQWKLPDGWEWHILGEECKTTSGGTPSRNRQDYFKGTIPWVKSGELTDGVVLEVEERITEDAVQKSSAKIFPQGTLLIALYGATVGKLGILGMDAATNQAVCAIFPSQRIDAKYLFWFLRTQRQELIKISTGGAQPNISQSIIRKISFPLPYPNDPAHSLEIQRRIVLRLETLLGEVKSARELQEKIEEETNLLVDAVLNEIFSSRDQWQNERRLDELVSIEASLVDPREPEYSSLPHIYGASIESGTGRLLEYQSAAEDGMTSSKYLFEPGVVLYSKIRPYLRKVTIADFKGVCSADMYPLTVTSEEILPEFLMWSLLSPEFTEFINAFSLRARIPKVNREQLMAYQVRYPDINSQKKIAAYIQNWREEVSEMQNAQNENAELLEQTEQSLLAQAFRGEL
jgi:type I restriction enzyme, S subunit